MGEKRNKKNSVMILESCWEDFQVSGGLTVKVTVC